MTMSHQIAALRRLSVKELRSKYAEVFGEGTSANNRDWLTRRVAWRMQELAEGGLSERAVRRAAELACDADLRVVPPREAVPLRQPALPAPLPRPARDGRLPPPGGVITRVYKGVTLEVTVLATGFEFAGQTYRSLSAVAKAMTGSHCNGFLFFKIGGAP